MIPKVIHYCWFGGSPLPDLAVKCIESWKKYCPDYQIIEWNESNYDFDCCDYVKEAYLSKKWAFVSDYARFDLLYKYGGLYFDTDVELIKDINDIVEKGAFMGREPMNSTIGKNGVGDVASGLGIGAVAKMKLYEEILSYYRNEHFINDNGTENLTTVVDRVSSILKKNGYNFIEDGIQLCGDVYIYPSDYFCPLDYYTGELHITNNTISIHHYSATWHDEREKHYYEVQRKLRKRFGEKIGYRLSRIYDFPHRVYNKIKKIGIINVIKYVVSKKHIKNLISCLVTLRHRLGHVISYFVYNVDGTKKKNGYRLLKLQNAYAGKRCFIICNGPSLDADDLTKIYENGDVSIGMNTIAKIYDKTPWRPTFLSVTDDIIFAKMHRKMVEECESGVKIYDATRYLQSKKAKGEKVYLTFDESIELLDKPKFDTDVFHKLPSIGTSTYSIIEFVTFLGCKEIYIIGCDMSYSINKNRDGSITYNESGKNHFFAKEEDALVLTNQKPVEIWKLQVAFDSAARFAKEYNLKIYNATRGGYLESFTRVNFDQLFSQDK